MFNCNKSRYLYFRDLSTVSWEEVRRFTRPSKRSMVQERLRTPALDGFHSACILFVYCKQYCISILIIYGSPVTLFIYTLCIEIFRDVLSNQWSKSCWVDWCSRSVMFVFYTHYVRDIGCETQYALLMLLCSPKLSGLGYGRLSVRF